MPPDTTHFIPHIALAPLRVGADPITLHFLTADPLAFATHYALLAEILPLDDEWSACVARAEKRYADQDRLLEFMEQLQRQLPPLSSPLSVELAKGIGVGMKLHLLVRQDRERYRRLCAERLAPIEAVCALSGAPLDVPGGDGIYRDCASIGERIDNLGHLLGLSTCERHLLIHALSQRLLASYAVLVKQLMARPVTRRLIWSTLLGCTGEDLLAALSPEGRLVSTGLITSQGGSITLSEFWLEVLIDQDRTLESRLLQPLVPSPSSAGIARLTDTDSRIIQDLLAKVHPGINVLLYGKGATDKRTLATRLIETGGGLPYTLAKDIPEDERPAATWLAQRLLAHKHYPGTVRQSLREAAAATAATSSDVSAHAEKSQRAPLRTLKPAPIDHPVLVVDKAGQWLAPRHSSLMALFGLSEEDGDDASSDELAHDRLLRDNPVPTLWLMNEAKRLPATTGASFLFHAEVQRGTRADRRAQLDAQIAGLRIAEGTKGELAKLEGFSSRQLESAVKLAELTAGKSRKVFGQHLLLAATRSQKALARSDRDGLRDPVTRYSLDLIHTQGRFGPAQILKALQHRPQGSLCLYGLPGTGKTQYAEHVAVELGRPILIKPASELLDKFLGESEKRIAAAFEEADQEGAVLLLDEADSFLRDRSYARHSWEVTLVNELLQRMERFEGIFICTTNLYKQIDMAALRRFTFKLEFLPLTLEQRWMMLVNEARLDEAKLDARTIDAWQERLALMLDLAPGDFATIQRQCQLLGEKLSPEEWLTQLEVEVRAKRRDAANDRDRQEVA